MAGEARQIIAAHYFYLLKEDEKSLGRLWSEIVRSSGGEITSNLNLADPLAMGGTQAERCTILNRVDGGTYDFCLAMLTNLAVIELVFRSGNDSPRDRSDKWTEFMAGVDEYRSRSLEQGISLFGESTLLVMPDGGAAGSMDIVTGLVDARTKSTGSLELPGTDGRGEARRAAVVPFMTSNLEPLLMGGGNPRLFRLQTPGSPVVDYWALEAADPEMMVASLFPELDSRLKELERSSSYFRQQRQSITTERTEVEGKVGALLHQHVQAENGSDPDAGELEERIGSLSRMFGLLATDSLMARQADNRLRRDVELLRLNLARLTAGGDGARDEIGEFYLDRYGAELDAVRGIARDLDYSRQNAEAAIEVIRTRVELLRAKEESAIQEQTKGLLKQILRLQEEGMALQVAAGLIEFVLIFYYMLLSWEHIIGTSEAEHLSPFMRLLPILGIAAGAALGTHFLARSIKNRTWRNPGLWITAAMMVVSLVAMVLISLSI